MRRERIPGRARAWWLVPAAMVLIAGGTGCEQKMANQPKYKPLASSDLFPDGQSARPLVPGVVARTAPTDSVLVTGMVNGSPARGFPFPVTRDLLLRGQERFNIYCSPCHGRLGDGQGMIVRRGFSPPPSFFDPRLIDAPPGHFFDVITHGYGNMYSYAARVKPADRWAITAYIRALQLSRQASLDDVPPAVRADLEKKRR